VTYDAIVVGARCAGAPTAMLLARRGYKVLLVDDAPAPSDMPLSTHCIWPSGARRLKDWGLLEQVSASGCPPIRRVLMDFGSLQLEGEPVPADGVRDALAPRRYILDRILAEAAVEAGAELRRNVTIEEVIWDDGLAAGVRGRSDGAEVAERARIIIGADGRTSRIAQLVEAKIHDEVPPLEGTYFAYWQGVPVDRAEIHVRPGRGVYAFPTNDGLTLVGANWAIADFAAARAAVERSYLDVVEACAPQLSVGLATGSRRSAFVGGATANIIRQPWGPGWALVGDAGVTVDPCTAAGINNAFRDVAFLAEALDQGLSGARPMDGALADYHSRRDAATRPIFGFTCDLAAFAPPSDEMAALFAALAGNSRETSRFFGVLAQTVSPTEFFAPASVARIMADASSI
jgi:2-polyprenyl-6-methoxyphenol hydroxylase-like FAD-dependent oxidoreductase